MHWVSRTVGDREGGVTISPEVLALVSAELAAQDQKRKGLGNLVYEEFSDDDDDDDDGLLVLMSTN